MAVKNNLMNGQGQGKENALETGITAFLSKDVVKAQINKAIGSLNSQRFITSVVSAVNNNAELQKCTNQSIFSAALLGESLNLSPSPQLGHYYLVPFNDNKAGTKVAQFQLGYKGYIQLAIRSGQYKKLNVMAIKEGELEYFDPLNEEIKINLMIDRWDEREEAKTIGYYAFFELTNGFRKAIYWSKKQMIHHADLYSQAFSNEAVTVHTKKYGDKVKVSFEDYEAGNYNPNDSWMYSSFWYKNFDVMAYKTMLRNLISKWGIMSIEMQNAFEGDMAFADETGKKSYPEQDADIIDMGEGLEAEPSQPEMKQETTPQQEEPQEAPYVQKEKTENRSVASALFGK